jgi:hypothetical protein
MAKGGRTTVSVNGGPEVPVERLEKAAKQLDLEGD